MVEQNDLCVVSKILNPNFSNYVKQLINDPAIDINQKNSSGHTVLIYACSTENIEIVKMVLNRKVIASTSSVDLDARTSSGDTAIMVSNGNIEIIKMLITAGADLNIQNEEKFTLLILAVINGSTELVKMLIEEKVDLDLQMWHGDSALMAILQTNKNQLKIATLLLEAGARTDLKDVHGHTIFHSLLHSQGYVKLFDKLLVHCSPYYLLNSSELYKLLFYAVNYGHVDKIKQIFERFPIKDNPVNDRGNTLLMEACRGREVEAELNNDVKADHEHKNEVADPKHIIKYLLEKANLLEKAKETILMKNNKNSEETILIKNNKNSEETILIKNNNQQNIFQYRQNDKKFIIALQEYQNSKLNLLPEKLLQKLSQNQNISKADETLLESLSTKKEINDYLGIDIDEYFYKIAFGKKAKNVKNVTNKDFFCTISQELMYDPVKGAPKASPRREDKGRAERETHRGASGEAAPEREYAPNTTPTIYYFERKNIEKWLLTSKTHPFTRQKMTINDIVPATELKEQIKAYILL